MYLFMYIMYFSKLPIYVCVCLDRNTVIISYIGCEVQKLSKVIN